MNAGWEFKQRMRQQAEAARQQQIIETAARETLEVTAKDYQQFQLLIASLDADLKRISNLPTGETRNEVKRDELIPKYLPYVQEYRKTGELYKNPVLAQMVIWLFDTGDIHSALYWAFFAIEQKQPMPERFNRNLPTFVSDSVLEWCKLQYAMGGSIEPYFSRTFEKLINDCWPVNDAVRSKYHKEAGKLLELAHDWQGALDHFIKATELDTRRAKCQTRIDKLRKKLNDSPPAAGTLVNGVETGNSQPASDSQGGPATIQENQP